jgi:hypothetical protein
MQYMLAMLTLPNDGAKLSSSELKVIEDKHAKFRRKYEASGTLLNGAGLVFRKNSLIVSLDHQKAEPIASSGDELEMTAYYIIDCATDAEAAGIARELLDGHVVEIEIRKIHHSSGM